MRFGDLLSLPLIALWQQKSRTVLTTLGVVFGSFVLAASLSIGQGVQQTIDSISRRSDLLRTIAVSGRMQRAEAKSASIPVTGEMSDAKRQRIRAALAKRQARTTEPKPGEMMSRKRLAELAALAHVAAAVPILHHSGQAVFDGHEQPIELNAIRPGDPACQKRLVAGRMFSGIDEQAVIVSELLLYQCGLQKDSEIASVLGKKLRLQFLTQQAATFTLELPIVGVVRLATEEDRQPLWDPLAANGDCLLPIETALNLADSALGTSDWDIPQVIVLVDDEDSTRAVYDRIRTMEFNAFAALDEIDRERLTYTLVFGGMTCVAAVAMLVSAMGIANTMLMSVLERTREIGIMKAVGASPRHILSIFLIEGALIGLVGGALGLVAAWCASFPGDAWIHSMVGDKFPIKLDDDLFIFPNWIVMTVMTFSLIVTTLAAFYPARRAANIDPVAALRHE